MHNQTDFTGGKARMQHLERQFVGWGIVFMAAVAVILILG